MSIYKSGLWTEDLDRIIRAVPQLERLEGKRVLVTGAGGLICSALTDVLLRYSETHERPVTVYAAGRHLEKLKERFSKYLQMPFLKLMFYDAAADTNDMEPGFDYIIHGAGNASPDRFMKEPVETMVTNFNGMLQLLKYAKENETQRLLFISSSEVYGKKDKETPFREDEYGWIELLNPRSSYPVGKRAAETLCASFAGEYGTDAVIVRPGHIYGPTASENDRRVSSAFAFQAARGEDLVLKSDGAQIRSYCYCLDCASAILQVLLCGENGTAYNISNPDSILSILEMAEILAEAGGVQLSHTVPDEEERKQFNPMKNSSLDSTRLQQTGWEGCFDAETGLRHTVQILKEMAGQTD